MKNLKSLIVIGFIAVLAINPVKAQKGAIKGEFTQTLNGVYLECTGDYLNGDVFNVYILSANTVVVKIRDSEIIGEPSGKKYEVTVTNTNRGGEDWLSNPNWEQTRQFWCEGKLVATDKMLSRLIYNANGEVTVEFFHYNFECK